MTSSPPPSDADAESRRSSHRDSRSGPERETPRSSWAGWFISPLAIVLILLGGLYAVGFLLSKQTTPAVQLVYGVDDPLLTQETAKALRNRLSGMAGTDARVEAGDPGEVRVVVLSRDPYKVAGVKALIQATGVLRFNAIANLTDHANLIGLAEAASHQTQTAATREIRNPDGKVVGRWVEVSEVTDPITRQRELRVNVARHFLRDASTGQIVQLPLKLLSDGDEKSIAAWMNDQGIAALDVLVAVEPELEVRGDHLTFASLTFDENGNPALAITLGPEGAGRFFALTTSYAPIGSRQRQLGIVFDDQLISAPNILAPIRSEARITGKFTRDEIDQMVSILQAGQLPAKLSPQPLEQTEVEAPSWLSQYF